jgi:pantothenate kinase-related protein Tda10
MDERAAVWKRAAEHDPARRGFDDDRCWLPHFALPTGDGELSREPVEEDVRGSFAAIESLAGWCVATMPCDPRDAMNRTRARLAARELEAMAKAIRHALAHFERSST